MSIPAIAKQIINHGFNLLKLKTLEFVIQSSLSKTLNVWASDIYDLVQPLNDQDVIVGRYQLYLCSIENELDILIRDLKTDEIHQCVHSPEMMMFLKWVIRLWESKHPVSRIYV